MYLEPITRGHSYFKKVDEFTDVRSRSISDPDWQCKLSIRGNGSTLDKTANSDWEFILDSTDTNKLNVGTVFFQISAVNVSTSESILIDSGSVEIQPNMAAADKDVDFRTPERIQLDEVTALISKLVKAGGTIEYKNGTRGARKYDLAELRALRTELRTKVARQERAERIKAGMANPRNSYAKFRE